MQKAFIFFPLILFFFLHLPSFSPLRCGYSSFSNCLLCNSNLTGCSQCESYNLTYQSPGYTVSEGSCIKCLSTGTQSQNFGCNRCKGDDKCDDGGCAVGLYYNNGLCTHCPNDTNCLNCSSPTTCLNCKAGFYVDQGSCQTCNRKFPACSECSSTVCTKCGSGYLLSKGVCEPCLDTKCAECDSSSCKTCIEGYYPSNKQCFPCSVGNCTFCPDDFCQKCKSPLALNNSYWPVTCINCSDPLIYLQAGCDTCKLNEDSKTEIIFNCTQCQDSYFLENNNCSVCSSNCISCLNAEKCLKCDSSMILYVSSSTKKTCVKTCDTSKQQNILMNGVCYNCSAYYSGNCSQCDTSKCISCASPTPFLRPPWNTSCESCDLLDVDLIYGDGICYQNPSGTIDSIISDLDNVYTLTLSCEVPSVIYLVLGLEWGSLTGDASVLDASDINIVKNRTGTVNDAWIKENIDDPYWLVYARVTTNMQGTYTGFIKAGIKLSGDVYSMKIWCVSQSGNIVSLPVSKQFYPQYNSGYTAVIAVKTNSTLSGENKTAVAKALYQIFGVANAFRVLITDESVEINQTNSNARRLDENSTNNDNSSNASTVVLQTYFFYSPPNWTLNLDEFDMNISTKISEEGFLAELNKALIPVNITIFEISLESQDQQSEPSFSDTQLLVSNTNKMLQFSLQLNKVSGYVTVAVAESSPVKNDSNATQTTTSLSQRLPTWELMEKRINGVGTNFSNYQRFYIIQGKKTTVTIENLNANTTYDIYFGAINTDFPNIQETIVYGALSFTKINIFGMRVGIMWGMILAAFMILYNFC